MKTKQLKSWERLVLAQRESTAVQGTALPASNGNLVDAKVALQSREERVGSTNYAEAIDSHVEEDDSLYFKIYFRWIKDSSLKKSL